MKSKINENRLTKTIRLSKKILFSFLLMAGISATAQVKIGNNPTNIGASSLLELESTDKGLILPRVANTAAILVPVNGMLIYDISAKCTKVYESDAWSACMTADGGSPTVLVANCGGLNGTYLNGQSLTNASFNVTVSNNSPSPATLNFSASDLLLSGVSGLTVGTPTATPALSGGNITLNSGATVTITYPITGTPSSGGTLSASWSKLYLNCTRNKTINSLPDLLATTYCDTAVFSNSMANGLSIDGNTFKITLTNISGSTITNMPAPTINDLILNYTGSALPQLTVASVSPNTTFNIPSGGSQTITYTFSGTPTSVGTLTGVWNYAGSLTCSKDKLISNPPSLFATNYCDTVVLSPISIGRNLFGSTYQVTITNISGGTISNMPAPAITDLVFNYTGSASPSISAIAVLPNTTFSLANGASRTITYNLSGIPTTGGTLTSTWNYYGTNFSCTKTNNIGTLSTSFANNYCDNAVISPNMASNLAFTANNTFTITITNTSGGTIPNMPPPALSDLVVSYSGTASPALSVTAVSPNVTFSIANGASQTITYTLSGTPTTIGTLSAAWNYNGGDFTCTKTRDINTLSTLFANNYCDSAVYSSPMVTGVSITGRTFAVTITNTSGGTISNMPAPNISNLGLSYSGTTSVAFAATSVSAPTGTFSLANGASRTITYVLRGTATSAGTLTGVWNYGGDFTCTKTRAINASDASFTLPITKYIVSTNDGTPLVDIQGLISNSAPNQLVIQLPYTAGSGSYAAYSSSVVVGAAGEGGDLNGFSISYPAGTFAASGFIPVTVTIDGDGTYNAKRQLFGIKETIVTLPFLLNGDNIGNINLGVVGGIPDRAFDQTIYGANNHNFVYAPVTGADGRTWLNNNLGADYTNADKPTVFNPIQQASASNDFRAYGSLFQWGRSADGHEIINFTSATTGTALNGTTITLSSTDTPPNNLFINQGSVLFDWRNPQNNLLWQGEAGINNPCPVGYRLPTNLEWSNLATNSSITNLASGANSTLKFSAAGQRDANGSLASMTALSVSQSSTVNGNNVMVFHLASLLNIIPLQRRDGNSVRCIKD